LHDGVGHGRRRVGHQDQDVAVTGETQLREFGDPGGDVLPRQGTPHERPVPVDHRSTQRRALVAVDGPGRLEGLGRRRRVGTGPPGAARRVPAGVGGAALDIDGPGRQGVADHVRQRCSEPLGGPSQRVHLQRTDPHVLAEQALEGSQTTCRYLAVVTGTDDEATHRAPGEGDLDALAGDDLEVVGHEVVERSIEVERLHLDDDARYPRPVRLHGGRGRRHHAGRSLFDAGAG